MITETDFLNLSCRSHGRIRGLHPMHLVPVLVITAGLLEGRLLSIDGLPILVIPDSRLHGWLLSVDGLPVLVVSDDSRWLHNSLLTHWWHRLTHSHRVRRLFPHRIGNRHCLGSSSWFWRPPFLVSSTLALGAPSAIVSRVIPDSWSQRVN